MIEQYLSCTNESATMPISQNILELNKTLDISLKKFQDSPSHRIFGRIHKVLNIDENKNKLHSLPVICEINFLRLVSL